jgi:hypothetical protein
MRRRRAIAENCEALLRKIVGDRGTNVLVAAVDKDLVIGGFTLFFFLVAHEKLKTDSGIAILKS